MTVTNEAVTPFAAIEALVDNRGEYDDRMYAAADFVAAYGTLADVYDDQADLAKMQQSAQEEESAWTLITHWSVQRGDGLRYEPATYMDHMLDECETCAWLQGVYNHLMDLRQEDCTTCGRGFDGHVIEPGNAWNVELVEIGEDTPAFVPDWFTALKLCKEPWDRVREPLVEPPGKLGDYQVSEVCTARWVAPLSDGNYGIVYRSYYRCRTEDGDLIIEREDWYVVCTDPDDPEGTKLMEDSRSEDTESEDPEEEDLVALVDQSFDPELGEFHSSLPDAAGFRFR